jgi:hypothetical protein
MNKIISWVAIVIALIAVVLSVVGLVGGNTNRPVEFGASGTRFPNGISADTTSPIAGQVRGTTLTTTGASTFGGTVTVTTSNTATSSTRLGCIQGVATSTASPIVIEFSTAFLSTSTFSGATGATGGGLVVWNFGTCPQ